MPGPSRPPQAAMRSPGDWQRITQQFGVGGAVKTIQSQLPCLEQGHVLLQQVAQSPTQLCLEHRQGWGILNFSEPPIPVPHHPHRKWKAADARVPSTGGWGEAGDREPPTAERARRGGRKEREQKEEGKRWERKGAT